MKIHSTNINSFRKYTLPNYNSNFGNKFSTTLTQAYDNIKKQTSTVKKNNSGVTIEDQSQYFDKLTINFEDTDRDLLRKNASGLLLNDKHHLLIDYDVDKLPSIQIKDNHIEFPIDRPFKLGDYQGYGVAMRVFQYGGFETSDGGGLLKLEDKVNENEVTPFERWVMDQIDRFSPQTRKTVGNTSLLLAEMEYMGSGKETESHAKNMFSVAGINVGAELTKLGIDISKEFFVNGKAFIYEDNMVHLVEE